jgi:hypothetical protein
MFEYLSDLALELQMFANEGGPAGVQGDLIPHYLDVDLLFEVDERQFFLLGTVELHVLIGLFWHRDRPMLLVNRLIEIHFINFLYILLYRALRDRLRTFLSVQLSKPLLALVKDCLLRLQHRFTLFEGSDYVYVLTDLPLLDQRIQSLLQFVRLYRILLSQRVQSDLTWKDVRPAFGKFGFGPSVTANGPSLILYNFRGLHLFESAPNVRNFFLE